MWAGVVTITGESHRATIRGFGEEYVMIWNSKEFILNGRHIYGSLNHPANSDELICMVQEQVNLLQEKQPGAVMGDGLEYTEFAGTKVITVYPQN